MLGSFIANSLKRAPRFPLLSTLPKQAFAEYAYVSAHSSNNIPKPPRPVSEILRKDNEDFFDPKVKQLSEYMNDLKLEAVEKVYRNCDFEKDMLPALNILKRLHFRPEDLKFLFKRKPSLLRLSPSPELNDVAKLTEYVQSKWNLNDYQVRSMLRRNPWIVNFTNEQLQERIDFLRQKLKLTAKEVRRLLIIYPKVFNKSEDHVNTIVQILQDHIQLPDRTIGIYAARFPYFLCIRPDYLRDNIRTLLHKSFSNQQIINIMRRHPEPFTLKPGAFEMTFVTPRRARCSAEQTAKIFSENPRLMSVDPNVIMPRKIRALHKHELSYKFIKKMFRKHPRLFVKSIGSHAVKLRYLQSKMKIDVRRDPAFPAILHFSYANVIRPRGEIMLKKGEDAQWKDVLYLTDEQFVAKFDTTMEELNRIKSEYKEVNNELDYKVRFFSRYFSNRGLKAKY